MTALYCLERSSEQGEPKRASRAAAELADKPEDYLCCRSCGVVIAPSSALMKSDGGPLVFSNPHGLVFEIVRLSTAKNLTLHGEPTTDASWFSGYAWTIALCAGCRTHLGWRYDAAMSGVTPASFFGLLRAELIERRDLAD